MGIEWGRIFQGLLFQLHLHIRLAKDHRNWVSWHILMDISLLFAYSVDDFDKLACMYFAVTLAYGNEANIQP